MQEFIIPLAAASTAVGLVVAGVNIAKGKKGYVPQDEYARTLGRVHSRIDLHDSEIDTLKKETNSLGHKVDGLTASMAEVKYEVKTSGQLLQDVHRSMTRIETIIEERNKRQDKGRANG
jgi:uncharacterized protein YoxC